MNQRNKFLGKGWAFPPSFSPSNQAAAMSEDEVDIQQSLSILLSTTPGERIMHPSFGCKLNQFAFSELQQTTLTEIEREIRHAILFFESRIDVESITMHPETKQGKLLININYRIITTNTRSNMVYPFYLKEGTLIDTNLITAHNEMG